MARFVWTSDSLGNVTSQSETWPGEPTRPGVRTTSMAYDANNRLTNETIADPTATAYAYDDANNRNSKQVTGGSEPGQWSYNYNAANQLTSWQQQSDGSPAKSATLAYDETGNRIAQTLQDQAAGIQTTLYHWDAQDRLANVTMPDGSAHNYEYDYRTRRIGTTRSGGILPRASTAIVFAGGLSLAEYEGETGSQPATPTVEYTRGPDMGGGVGGMLYSLRGGMTKYSLSNGRGDIVAQADQGASLTWTASYEAYGKRTKETGTNQDKQRANSKDEDPTGLLNEGFRYRDIETGVWLSRDPAGFVDGPNLYAYVKENPWSAFDAHGLSLVGLEGAHLVANTLKVPTPVAPVAAGATTAGFAMRVLGILALPFTLTGSTHHTPQPQAAPSTSQGSQPKEESKLQTPNRTQKDVDESNRIIFRGMNQKDGQWIPSPPEGAPNGKQMGARTPQSNKNSPDFANVTSPASIVGNTPEGLSANINPVAAMANGASHLGAVPANMLPPGLVPVNDHDTHVSIRPAGLMPFSEAQKLYNQIPWVSVTPQTTPSQPTPAPSKSPTEPSKQDNKKEK